MKSSAHSFAWLFLLLLPAAAAWRPFSTAPAAAWVLPGAGGLALAVCLVRGSLSWRQGLAGGAIAALIALYAWNPTHRWSEGVGLLPAEHVSGWPGSAFPAGSREALGWAIAMGAGYAVAFRLSARQVRGMQWAALAAGVAMALAVLVQRLEPQPFPVYERTGLFVNENHFAVFSNMLLPVVLALAARFRFQAVQEGRPSSPDVLVLLAAVLMGAAVVLSRSRAGVAVMALLVVAHVRECGRVARLHPFVRLPISRLARRLGGVAIAVAAGLAVAAFAREWRHFSDVRGEWIFRSGILKDALSAWWAQPVWGTGPGTFSVVFPYYQSEFYQGRTLLHAHCDPVQFLFEFGWAGGLWVLLALGLGFSARNSGRPAGDAIPSLADLEGRAFALGLLACLVHSLIDFPLRVPLIAVLAAIWAGAWAGLRAVPAVAARARSQGLGGEARA